MPISFSLSLSLSHIHSNLISKLTTNDGLKHVRVISSHDFLSSFPFFVCNKLFLGTNIVNIELCAPTQIQQWTTDNGDYILKRYYMYISCTHPHSHRQERADDYLFTWSSILNAIHCLSNENLNWKYFELGSYSGADISVFIFNGHKPPKCISYSCYAMQCIRWVWRCWMVKQFKLEMLVCIYVIIHYWDLHWSIVYSPYIVLTWYI